MKKKVKHIFWGRGLQLLNLIIAGLFLMSLLSGIIPPTKFAFLSVLGLFYPLLFYSNLFFILFWLFFRPKRTFISLFVLLLGIHTIPNHFAFHFSRSKADPLSYKVVSYNVQGFSHSNNLQLIDVTKKDIMHFLLAQKPDIACLQEYHSKDKSLYAPLKNTGKDLNTGSYFFQSYFGPRYDELIGLVIFSKFRKINNGYLKFNKHRTFAIYCDLLIGSDTVRVINVHLASISLKPTDIDFVANPALAEKDELGRTKKIYYKLVKAYMMHEKQMKAILKLVENGPKKVLLCGDMNDTPGSYTYHLATTRLFDSFTKKGAGMSVTYAGRLPFLRIDYIMTHGAINLINYHRIKVNYSDHYPITTRFRLSD